MSEASRKTSIELESFFDSASNTEGRYIADYDTLENVVDLLREKGLRIVLTQGVYDLIHEGHAKYLENALSYGDVLIVGVDTDEYTRERKGPNRPVVPFEERINMLAHLRHVSIITKRDVGMEVGDLIHAVRPDVLVTSKSTKDFPASDVAVYEKVCGKIVTLPPQATTSTTARIRFLTIDGADQLAQEIMGKIPNLVMESLNKMKQ